MGATEEPTPPLFLSVVSVRPSVPLQYDPALDAPHKETRPDRPSKPTVSDTTLSTTMGARAEAVIPP